MFEKRKATDAWNNMEDTYISMRSVILSILPYVARYPTRLITEPGLFLLTSIILYGDKTDGRVAVTLK